MPYLKKFLFAVPFLFSLVWFGFELAPFIINPLSVLDPSLTTLIHLIRVVSALVLGSVCFVLFATLADTWIYVASVAILGSIVSLFLLPFPQSLLLALVSAGAYLVLSKLISKTLASYLTFSAASLLGPSVKQLTTLLLLGTAICYFLAASASITRNGFAIPPVLLDQVLSAFPLSQNTDGPSLPPISPEQLALLRQNPQALKAFGLDESILKSLPNAQDAALSTKELVKATVTDQIDRFLKPYLSFIPWILTLIFFFTLQSLASLAAILLPPFLGFIFWFLEKIHFTSYTVETRQVKKLVV